MVEVTAVKNLKIPVTLEQIKSQPKLKNMALLKQSRLSVSPVTAEEWDIICKMGA
jgi:predicted RNA-binding protein with PUA-like domain